MLSIDLSGSEKQRSGFAYFLDEKIFCGSAFKDSELLNLAEQFGGPIGIDAPLSLPYGRNKLEDKGPHFRECDLMLRKMKIRFFPVTLGPMRKLTIRGMRLAKMFRECGYQVVELYPGGSLDLLSIPRKNVGAVNSFLSSFECEATNIDESDAAIGLFTLWLMENSLSLKLQGKDGSIVLANPAVHLGKLIEGIFVKRRGCAISCRIENKVSSVHAQNADAISDYLFKGNLLYIAKQRGRYPRILKAIKDPLGEKVMAYPHSSIDMAIGWLRMKGIVAKRNANIGKGAYLSWEGGICKVEEVYSHYKRSKKEALFCAHQQIVRQFNAMAKLNKNKKMVLFISHFPADKIVIDLHFPDAHKIFEISAKQGIKLKAISTRILGNYWIFEKEIPIR